MSLFRKTCPECGVKYGRSEAYLHVPINSSKWRARVDRQMKPYDWRAETEKMHRATFKPPKWRNEE